MSASAGRATAQAPAQDSAVGSVVTEHGFFPDLLPATFDARSGPSGENSTGSVRVQTRAFLAAGPVTCLTVTGNRATIGFADTEFPEDNQQGGFLFVEDNSPAGPDKAELSVVGTPAPTVCPANTIVYPSDFVLVDGGLTVVDARPSPTAKDQCKEGGWAQFGFRNQGHCVAFVFRAPKP